MRVLPANAELSEKEIGVLGALRAAKENGTQVPGVPFDTALRLSGFGYARSKVVQGIPTGGCEITDQGLAHLAALRR